MNAKACSTVAPFPAQVEEVPCVVCGTETYEIICPASEVKVHHNYLRRFHMRRLHGGRPSKSDLTDRVEFTQNYATHIVACTACGFVFRNPRPSRDAVTQTYAKDHYGHDHLATAFAGQLPLSRLKAQTFQTWLPRRPCTRIVEVGSFAGSFLAVGQERGWSMLGIDPGQEVTAFCKERGLPVYRGSLDDAGLQPQSVDGVAIWNTFDQLPDPDAILETVQCILRPDGVLVVRVPNGAFFRVAEEWIGQLPRLFSGWLLAAMAWNNLLAFPYLHGYSVASLDRLIGRHGMQRVAVYPDTLMYLADGQTKAWAAWEEQAIKFSCRLLWSLERARTGDSLCSPPWFDAYYRKRSMPAAC